MKMNAHGTIEHDGFTIRNTPYGWNISIGGSTVGEASSLGECETFIASHKATVRANLARITQEREERAAQERQEGKALASTIAAATKRDS